MLTNLRRAVLVRGREKNDVLLLKDFLSPASTEPIAEALVRSIVRITAAFNWERGGAGCLI